MQPAKRSSFLGLSKEEIRVHKRIKRYGNFTLTNAVIPSYNLEVMPKSGFRRGFFREVSVSFILISASKESLFDLFIEIARLMSSSCVDVFIKNTYRTRRIHLKKYRESSVKEVDLFVVLSRLYDFEELLVDDGCTGIAIVNQETGLELQFDEDKILTVCNWQIIKEDLLAILEKSQITEDPQMKFIFEAEHRHSTSLAFLRQFNRLKIRLSAKG